MAHPEQLVFIHEVKQKYPKYFQNTSVLEVGSLNINGTVRQFFEDCFYIGLDVAPGPDVDVVCLGHEYKVASNTFDVLVSTECFEHDPYWEKTFLNMFRLCKNDGLLMFTCATTGRQEHGTSKSLPESSPLTIQKGWEYYRNLTEEDFRRFDLRNMFSRYEFSVNHEHHDLYFYGIKK